VSQAPIRRGSQQGLVVSQAPIRRGSQQGLVVSQAPIRRLVSQVGSGSSSLLLSSRCVVLTTAALHFTAPSECEASCR